MKSTIFLPLLLMLFALQSTAQITVGDPELVALQNPWGNTRPRVVLNADGDPVVIWTNNSEGNVYCSKKTGTTFSEPQKLNPDGMTLSTFDWSGPEVASMGNKLVTVMKATPEMEGHIYIVISEDGGVNWGDTIRVEDSAPLMSRMPSVAMDEDGNPFVSFLRQDMGTFSEWAVAKSIDGGMTFLPPVSTSTLFTDAVCDCCPSSLMVNGERVILVYRNNEDNLRDMRASISNDGGMTFQTQYDLDNTNWVVQSCPASGPSAYLAGDILCSTWMSDASDDSRVYFSSFDLVNATLDQNVEILPATSNVVQNYPSVSGNEFIRAVAFENNPVGQRNIVFLYSALTPEFTPQETIELTVDMDGNQQRPNMIYLNGVFHLVYTDNGGDAVIYQKLTATASDITDHLESTMLIYPNPMTHGVLNIQLNDSKDVEEIKVMDTMNRTCSIEKTDNALGHITMDLSTLQNGIYCVQFYSATKLIAQKIVIKQDE